MAAVAVVVAASDVVYSCLTESTKFLEGIIFSEKQAPPIMDLKESEDSKLRWLPAQKSGLVLIIIPVILALPAFLFLEVACDSFVSLILIILLLILLMILLLVGTIMCLFSVRINKEWICKKFVCSNCDSRSYAPINNKNVKIEPLNDPWFLNAILELISLSSESGDHSHNALKESKITYVLKCSCCGQLSQYNYRHLRGSAVFNGQTDNDEAKPTSTQKYYG